MMRRTLSLVLASALVTNVGCAQVEDAPAEKREITLRMESPRPEGGTRAIVATSSEGKDFEGTQTELDARGKVISKTIINLPYSMATWPRTIKEDGQGAYIEVSGQRNPVENIERLPNHFAADLTTIDGVKAHYELEGEVDHFAPIIIGAIVVIGVFCGGLVVYESERCDRRGGDWKFNFYGGLGCSGECKTK